VADRGRETVFIVTAGPTREHLDPVRFLSNPSTGKMGFAVAAAAARRGCRTVLVAGPVSLPTPDGVERIDVVSARDMFAAVRKTVAELRGRNVVLVATAAVADWRPRKCAAKKLKKSAMSGTLELVRNPDILKTAKGVRKVGFAAETGDAIAEAARKCREKNLEFIVANDVTRPGAGFGTDTNLASFVYPDGRVRELALMSKRALAGKIVDEVLRA
jgi:phosphopantothenoylcysteine decarboxylase/phosphopantothenate--cysteine ligase